MKKLYLTLALIFVTGLLWAAALGFPHRFIMIVTAAEQAACNTAAGDWDPDTGGADTFGVPANVSGSWTNGHDFFYAESDMNDAMRTALFAITNANIKAYDAYGGWTLDSALADLGLVRITLDIPGQ